VQDLVGQRFVIVLDDVDAIPRDDDLGRALSMLAARRSRCRFVLSGKDLPTWLLDDPSRQRAAYVRLTPFTWEEVWRWIRRNHRVLTQFGKDGLAMYYPRLGSHLQLWGQVAELVAQSVATPDIEGAVDAVAPPRPTPPDTEAPMVAVPRGQRPLRVAIAGPQVTDPQRFAVALTVYAAQHHVGGRAIVPTDDTSSTLGVLLPIESPFAAKGYANDADIIKWLMRAGELGADILVLDYGAPAVAETQLETIRRGTGRCSRSAP
jgi:hypothetical protein